MKIARIQLTDIGLPQRRRIIHSVPSDPNNLIVILECLHNLQLLSGRSTSEYDLKNSIINRLYTS